MKLTPKEMSSFLMYRMTHPEENHTIEENFPNRVPVTNFMELEEHLRSSDQKSIGGGYSLSA